MKNTNTNYLLALFISTIIIFATPYLMFGQNYFYTLDLQDSDNYQTELLSETGQIHTSAVQWKVMGDNTGFALAYLEPIADLSGYNEDMVVILEFYLNRTGFLLEDDFVIIQTFDSRHDTWTNVLYLDANVINSIPGNRSFHKCAITPDMYNSISDFRARILVKSSLNGSPIFIRDAEIWMSEAELPLNLSSFTASAVGSRNILLKWTTANEYNVNRFEIERSENATDWQTVGAVNYTETTQGQYIFWDRADGANAYYYRLKIIDNDGQYAYSRIVGLQVKFVSPHVFPTVATDIINVEIDFIDNADFHIYNTAGKLVYAASDVSGNTQIDVSTFPAGTYFLQSTFGDSWLGQTFIVSR